MRGVPIKVIQEYAGHSDIRITMRYSHLSPEVGRAAVSLLDGDEKFPIHGSSVAVSPPSGGRIRDKVVSLQKK